MCVPSDHKKIKCNLMKTIKLILNFFLEFRLFIEVRRKNKKILRNIKRPRYDKKLVELNKNYWRKIDKLHNATCYKIFSSINSIHDKNYISEQTYYNKVEPTLNNLSFSEAYSDKNFYSKIFSKKLLPQTYMRCIDGVFYDDSFRKVDPNNLEDLLKDEWKIIIKKSIETGGGKGVWLYLKINGRYDFLDFSGDLVNNLYYRFGKNFIVQQYINQHNFFKKFNESSVNTIRILTYRSVLTNEIIVINSVFRIGKKGSYVDNQSSGGISCGINLETGFINDFAIDKLGNITQRSNGTNFSGEQVPFFGEMKELAKEIGEQYRYHRLLGFDFTVDTNNNIKVLEVNTKNNEINFYQMNNGPLFGIYSDEILDYCMKFQKTINIDFSI